MNDQNTNHNYWWLFSLPPVVLLIVLLTPGIERAEPPQIIPSITGGQGVKESSIDTAEVKPVVGRVPPVIATAESPPIPAGPPIEALKQLKAAAGDNYGMFDKLAWDYIKEFLARGSGDDGDELFEAIQEVAGPGSTRAFLLAWYFSNIKESDFPKLPRLLKSAALDARELDQFETGIRNNRYGVTRDFDGYYEFFKMVNSITGVTAMYDTRLASKFSQKVDELPESERRRQVDALLAGDEVDRYIGFEYLRQQDLKTANELLGDSKLPSEVRDELAEYWIPAMARQSPTTALEMAAKLDTGTGKKDELEARIVAEWVMKDSMTASKWVNEVEDPAKKKAFSMEIAKYLRSVGSEAEAAAWENATK
jgi:hypothetical protein